VAGRERNDQIPVYRCQCACCQDQTAVWSARERRHGALDLGRAAQVDRTHVHSDRRRRGLDDGELADPGGKGRIAQHRRARDTGRDLLEQFQPLRAQPVFELHEAGGVAARLGQALDEAGANWIRHDHEYGRHDALPARQRSLPRCRLAR